MHSSQEGLLEEANRELTWKEEDRLRLAEEEDRLRLGKALQVEEAPGMGEMGELAEHPGDREIASKIGSGT